MFVQNATRVRATIFPFQSSTMAIPPKKIRIAIENKKDNEIGLATTTEPLTKPLLIFFVGKS